MADTWTYAAGVWTLAMDGSGSGQESRSRLVTGLTPSTLYTFYSTVNPDTAAVGPFIEVDGGDRTTISTTGSHLALVRGTTDGSGHITLRRGVADAGDAPAAAGSDALSYANAGAATSAGWVSAAGAGSITFNTGEHIGAFTTSVKLDHNAGTNPTLTKTFTVINGATYTVGIWLQDATGSSWFNNGYLLATSGANHKQLGSTGGVGEVHKSGTIVANGSSLTIQLTSASGTFYFAGLTIDGLGGTSDVTWTDWDYCIGTGTTQTPGETGGGEDGTDPIPAEPPGGYPPPPIGGARPFTAYGIPTGGLAYWNGSVKKLKAAFAVNQLNESMSSGAFNFFTFGETSDWLVGGVFSFDKWADIFDACAEDSVIGSLLDDAIQSAIDGNGGAFGHQGIDEPYHPTRYGGPIGIATVERMCLKSKARFPTWPVMIRVAPTFSWVTKKIAGCDWLWAEYLTKRGDCATYRDTNIARAQALGYAGCIMGLHYAQFTGVGGRDITPSEILHYGKIMAAGTPSMVPAMGGWQWQADWYKVAGAAEAVHQLRDYFASLDP